MSELPGGFGPAENATKETQKLCDQVKSKVEEKTQEKYDEFTAVKYRCQIVSGRNFIIKVHVGGLNYIHLSVFEALPCNGGQVVLKDVQQHKTKDDPIVPF